jgi:chromosomal replication initiation ATPase DnaA
MTRILLKNWGKKKGSPKSFIKESLSRLKEGIVSRKETSHRKLLEATYQSDEIVNAVSAFFSVDDEKVLNNRKEYRNICIYIMKKYTGMTNTQIGQIFNGLTFSAVAKVYYRMAKAIEENRAMKKKVGKIISTLS